MSVDLQNPCCDATRPSRVSDQRPPRGLYVFTVTALTVFLGGLLLWGRPTTESVVSVELGCALGGDAENDGQVAPDRAGRDVVAAAVDRLTSSAGIQHALAKLPEVDGTSNQSADAARAVRAVRGRLRVRLEPSRSGTERIHVSYRGQDPHWSLALLDQLARDFLLDGAAVAARPSRHADLGLARWRVDEAKHYERKARLELDALVETLLAERGVHASRPVVEQASFDGDTNARMPRFEVESMLGKVADSTPQPSAAAGRVNPRWRLLQQQLTDSTHQLDKLRERLTPDHPQVQALQATIQDARQVLESTPKYVDADAVGADGASRGGSAGADGGPDPASRTAGAPPIRRDQAGADENVAVYADTLAAYRVAVRRRERAETALWQLIDRSASAPVAVPVQARWMAMPPTVVQRFQNRTRPWLVLFLGCGAIAVGVCMVWLTRATHAVTRINTVADVSRFSQLPVVGQLALDPAPRGTERVATRAKLIRGVTLVCEISLASMVALFVWGIFAHSGLSIDFADDPLAVFADTIGRAIGMWH